MGDHIDDLMTKRWPALTGAVSAGLKTVKPALKEYVPVEPMKDATPYRPSTISWDPISTFLSQCNVHVDGAYELSVTHNLDVDTLDDDVGFKLLTDGVEDFARRVRRAEREVLFLFLDSAESDAFPYTRVGIIDGVEILSRPCRLIGVSDELAKRVVKEGIVEQSVDPQNGFRSGAKAVLLNIGTGPKWRRLAADLTPTWQRTSDAEVELRLSERFFLDNPTRVCKLFE